MSDIIAESGHPLLNLCEKRNCWLGFMSCCRY